MNRLYKSRTDKVFEGVCGGIGEYFGIDPVVIRLLWVVMVIFGGTGVLAYLIAMLIIPKDPKDDPEEIKTTIKTDLYSDKFWGVLLIVAGLLLLVGFIGPVGGLFAGAAIFMSSMLWPALIIGLGLYLYFGDSKSNKNQSPLKDVFPEGKKLTKSAGDKKIAGVCGGIGAYFNVDSNIIRIFWTMATLGSFGFGVLAYFSLAIFLSESE